jgi:hypothetical protein
MMTSRPKILEVKHNGISVNLKVDLSIGIGGDKWPAATQYCALVSDAKWFDFFSYLFDGKKIIELGAGTGLVSILIDKLYKPDVLLVTDLDSHIDLICENIAINSCSKCIPRSFDWKIDKMSNYDVILIFECVYNEDLYIPLINAIDDISTMSTVIFLGLTRLFTKPKFFQLLRGRGFKYTMIPEESLPEEYGAEFIDNNVALFVVRRMCYL